MKVIHVSDRQLVLEDKPWLIGILMILAALLFLAGSMALFSAGEILGGAMMGVIGVGVPLLIAALMVQRVRLTLDRDGGTITRVSRSVIGLTQESYALDRLTEVRVGISATKKGSTTYRLELHLVDPPESVPFTSYYSAGSTAQSLVDEVKDWLAMPRETSHP